MSEDIGLEETFRNTGESCVERELFLAVILQALLDATKEAYEGEPDEAVEDRRAATHWFFCSVGVTSQDFKDVCELAGVDSEYTRTFAHKIIRTGEVKFVRKKINALLAH